MNLAMSVEMTLVIFLLCSGYSHFTFASNRLRVLRRPDTENNKWNVVSLNCNETGESYVTLYDEEDVNFIAKNFQEVDAMNSNEEEKKVWLGLHKNPKESNEKRNTTWSNGDPVIFTNISLNVSNEEQLCVAIDNVWEGFNCSEKKPFLCDNGVNYTLIPNNKSWCQALQYCRIHFVDLASISNDTQNNDAIKTGNNTSFWIGLMLDQWEWKDGSCSSFREWSVQGQSDSDEIYTTLHNRRLFRTGDGEESSICSKGIMRIRVINKTLTWEEAFNYCKANHTDLLWINDQDDQTAVEQWLNHTDVEGPFWIGLRQSRVFGFWIWHDRGVSDANWGSDLKPPELPIPNQCGAFNEMDKSWIAKNCSDRLPFLCEEAIVFMNKSRMVHPTKWVSNT